MKKWASKERGLRYYGEGKDVYGRDFYVQDGSWAEFEGIRIYAHNSDNEGTSICISLKKDGLVKMLKALQFALDKVDL